MSNIKTKIKEKGVSLYFVLIVLAVLTSALLAVVALVISQTQAIYALDD